MTNKYGTKASNIIIYYHRSIEIEPVMFLQFLHIWHGHKLHVNRDLEYDINVLPALLIQKTHIMIYERAFNKIRKLNII